MQRHKLLRCLMVAIALGLTPPAPAWVLAGQESEVFRVPSKDGTLIAVEGVGSGPSLVIAHGGIGDRTPSRHLSNCSANSYTLKQLNQPWGQSARGQPFLRSMAR
jgi:hypothetical protein